MKKNNHFIMKDKGEYELECVIGRSVVTGKTEVFTSDEFLSNAVERKPKRVWSSWKTGYDTVLGDFAFRTNGKKVEVKVHNKIGSASCCDRDEFNLSLGVDLAKIRALNKIRADRSTRFVNKYGNIFGKEVKFDENS